MLCRNVPLNRRLGNQRIISIVLILSFSETIFSVLTQLGTGDQRDHLDELTRIVPVEKNTSAVMDPRNISIREDLAPTLYSKLGPEDVWRALLQEGSELLQSKVLEPDRVICLEVGMYRLVQCRLASERGFQTHCVEASAKNFKRVFKTFRKVQKNQPEISDRIHLYNAVAARHANQTMAFSNTGSTGDSVLAQSAWSNRSTQDWGKHSNISTVKLDDIARPFDSVFLAKIDTQGYESEVLEGFMESLQQQKIQFLLMEYWPRAMDRLASSSEPCEAPVRLLQTIAQAGYTLYQLSFEAHSSAPVAHIRAQKRRAIIVKRPFSNIIDNCNWFYDLETEYPGDNGIGYWTDVLAVSPKSVLPKFPVTSIGQILQQSSGTDRSKSPV